MRFALTIEYDGSGFSGFQRQLSNRSVQQELETAIFRATSEHCRTTAAGRTDAGVHALAQVVSFSSETGLEAVQLVKAVNFYLPRDVSVLEARVVRDTFDARRKARGRDYRYLVVTRGSRSALWLNRALWVSRELNVTAMQSAADALVGEHDFGSFMTGAPKPTNTVRRCTKAIWMQEGNMLSFEMSANAFLMHQVRNTVGSLIEVGRGRLSAEGFRGLLANKRGGPAGPTAPAHGLYLVGVEYPEEEMQI